jgi:hypothetical protein
MTRSTPSETAPISLSLWSLFRPLWLGCSLSIYEPAADLDCISEAHDYGAHSITESGRS